MVHYFVASYVPQCVSLLPSIPPTLSPPSAHTDFAPASGCAMACHISCLPWSIRRLYPTSMPLSAASWEAIIIKPRAGQFLKGAAGAAEIYPRFAYSESILNVILNPMMNPNLFEGMSGTTASITGNTHQFQVRCQVISRQVLHSAVARVVPVCSNRMEHVC